MRNFGNGLLKGLVLMLAIAPKYVRAEKIGVADDPDRTTDCVFAHPVNRTSANGVTGSPSRATADKAASGSTGWSRI